MKAMIIAQMCPFFVARLKTAMLGILIFCWDLALTWDLRAARVDLDLLPYV